MSAEKPLTTFSLNPLLWLAASFVLGVVAAHLVHISISVSVILTAVFSVVAVFLQNRTYASPIVVAAFAALGAVCHSVEQSNIEPDRIKELIANGMVVSGNVAEVEGTLSAYPEPAPDGIFFIVNTDKIRSRGIEKKTSGRVRFFLPIQNEEAVGDVRDLNLRYGSRIRVACRLMRENQFLNLGVTRRTELLDRQGIDATANLKSPLLIEPLGRDPVFLPLAFVYELRAHLIERIRVAFQSSTGGILIASAFGNKHFLDKQTADIFREGGTFHVLVISGLHITFIGGLVLLIARAFTRNRRLNATVVLSVLWLYGIAVGGDPPVIRACVMFTILMVGYASYRTSTLLNSLGACVLILLVWRPSDLFDPSFQLTVASVAAIICLALPLLSKLRSIGDWMPTASEPFPPKVPLWLMNFCEAIYWRPAAWGIEQSRNIWSASISKSEIASRIDRLGIRRILTFVFEGIVISIAVQIVLLPFTVVYFHRVSFASVLLNLWVGPLLALESFSAFFAIAIGTISDLAAMPFVFLTEILNWLLVTVPAFANVGWSSFRIPIYSGWLYGIYFIYFIPVIAIAVLAMVWDPFDLRRPTRQFKRLTATFASLALAFAGLVIFHPFSAPRPDGRLHIEFLDVGQGDAAFIKFPGGRTMLVDAGGRVNYADDDAFEPDLPRIGEAVVSEFLWERGISRIDYIVATHADADHIQGLVDITKNFRVGRAYFGRFEGDDPNLKELISELESYGVPREMVAYGDVFEIDGVRIEVLNPFQDTRLSPNNDSVVLRIVYGNISFLLTGDIEREGEDLILRSGIDLLSTVVKVPHHGSRTSSAQAFIDSVRPQIAVISVGLRSPFGHPHADVVERWKAAGANVITTGENGTVTFSTDGRSLEMSTFFSK